MLLFILAYLGGVLTRSGSWIQVSKLSRLLLARGDRYDAQFRQEGRKLSGSRHFRRGGAGKRRRGSRVDGVGR